MKTYGWQSPETLRLINSKPEILSLLYDLGLLPEEISARVRGYVEAERERCAKVAERVAGYYSANNGDNKEVAQLVAKEIREGRD